MSDEAEPETENANEVVEKSAREHELLTFLRQDLVEIASEYERIFARATEDPGTAGDEGEENWAGLLRAWLPESYKIVTKGRVLGIDGRASPQIDLLVLRPGYPSRLLNKKVYLVHGVAAAFECKTTLKSHHLREAAATAVVLRSLSGERTSSPYRELTGTPTYGILAHSHSWKGKASTPIGNVDGVLRELHKAAEHPRNLVDLVCVADLACWTLTKIPYLGRALFGNEWPTYRDIYGFGEEGGASTSYSRPGPESDMSKSNPVAAAIATILQQLAWEDPSTRPLADYFRLAGLGGSSEGEMRHWPLHAIYSADVAASLERGGTWRDASGWNEWGQHLP
ncbi:DUF6602 domain-containing protein [Arthrobacter oryzae]|uniref:DUF6602 domain-containing protein n=1 Tax=Arthrobacter oryzae TaxID=409290 RepID=UPI00285DFA67|nr:DUF6602 domain-containing protein [Arthrobacter oryzae]MDR6507733.1 hypothetical protein [Arthrobacter oryzae]